MRSKDILPQSDGLEGSAEEVASHNHRYKDIAVGSKKSKFFLPLEA
jgi:hypothetical protein